MKEKLQLNQITNLIRNVHVLLAVMWTQVLKTRLTLPLQNKNGNEKKKVWLTLMEFVVTHFRLDCLRLQSHKFEVGSMTWDSLVAREKCAFPRPVGECFLQDAGSRKGKLFQLLHQDMPDIRWWLLNWLGHSLQGGHCLIWKHWTTTHQALKKLAQKKAWLKLCRYVKMRLNGNTYLE